MKSYPLFIPLFCSFRDLCERFEEFPLCLYLGSSTTLHAGALLFAFKLPEWLCVPPTLSHLFHLFLGQVELGLELSYSIAFTVSTTSL